MRKQNFVLPLAVALAFAGTAHAAGGTTTSGTGTASTAAAAPGPVNPPATEAVGVVISENGERVAVNTVASVVPAPATSAPTVALTPAERAAQQRMRAKTERKQQLMHSITPRTNNDRTDQMPDDPIIVP